MDQFLQLVRDYVALIESCHSSSALELLRGIARVLPALYAAGLDLPDRSPTSGEAPAFADIQSPMADLARLLGAWDVYCEVFDPCKDTEAIHQTLSDDLADIYIDLKRELDAFDGGAVDDAIWSWRFTLAGHCGDHIVDAMRVIHRRIHEDVLRLAAG